MDFFLKKTRLIKRLLSLLFFIGMFGLNHAQEALAPVYNYKEILEQIFYEDYLYINSEIKIDSITTAVYRGIYRVYYVYFFSRGLKMRAEYDDRLIWQFTYTYLLYEQLKIEIRKHLEENYGDFRIVDIRFQDSPVEGESYYKIDVTKGSDYFQLRYLIDGSFWKAKRR